jgi:phosphogluconate dehydratase
LSRRFAENRDPLFGTTLWRLKEEAMPAKLHPVVAEVTERIRARSKDSRAAYLEGIEAARRRGRSRHTLSCGNLAHGFAACPMGDKSALRGTTAADIAIVTAYNDMLSAHQPYASFPDVIKAAAREAGAVAQVAGGTPAMCDGVIQGQTGMELSLFSRDVIALSTALALAHDMFDATLMLGICDKIVPGLLIGALRFGHLPAIFVPGGPMPSGLPNSEKARIRQLYAEGKAGREALLDAESASYHSPGTCTFYGTANSNQMLMELMGLHLPGAAFVNPNTPLRDALTAAAARRVAQITAASDAYTPIARIIDERALVNGIVGLHVTGGSTNHTIHLVAVAAAAGIVIDWNDFEDLSAVAPLMARIYPSGTADVNHFHAAGGMGFLVRELIGAGLVHEDVETVVGRGLSAYAREPYLDGGALIWRDAPAVSGDEDVLRGVANPFASTGGLRLVTGNLGRGVIKASAVKPEHRVVEAPAAVFDDQNAVQTAFKSGQLDRDVVVVVRFQGPRANGMPEMHKLTPALGVLLDRGFKVALVTDGRMSGASGKVAAAIHVWPEAACGGALARLKDGDMVRVDGEAGVLEVLVNPAEWAARPLAAYDPRSSQSGLGRELFAPFRALASSAEEGATPLSFAPAPAREPVVA